jgi:hypothetical protein
MRGPVRTAARRRAETLRFVGAVFCASVPLSVVLVGAAHLLGMARRNPFQADAEAEPPDGQLAQPVERVRGTPLSVRMPGAACESKEGDCRVRR